MLKNKNEDTRGKTRLSHIRLTMMFHLWVKEHKHRYRRLFNPLHLWKDGRVKRHSPHRGKKNRGIDTAVVASLRAIDQISSRNWISPENQGVAKTALRVKGCLVPEPKKSLHLRPKLQYRRLHRKKKRQRKRMNWPLYSQICEIRAKHQNDLNLLAVSSYLEWKASQLLRIVVHITLLLHHQIQVTCAGMKFSSTDIGRATMRVEGNHQRLVSSKTSDEPLHLLLRPNVRRIRHLRLLLRRTDIINNLLRHLLQVIDSVARLLRLLLLLR